jgi:2'-5' RNA ligase
VAGAIFGDGDGEDPRGRRDPGRGRGRASPFSVRPRPRGSLHLTLFFGGEGLGRLPEQDLEAFHARVSSALLRDQGAHGLAFEQDPGRQVSAATGDLVDGTERGDSSVVKDPRFCFRIAGLRTFPPRRNNLVVAELEAPEAWTRVRGAILQGCSASTAAATSAAPSEPKHTTTTTTTILTDSSAAESNHGSRDGDGDGPCDENRSPEPIVTLEDLAAMNPPRWIPHVTLANVATSSRGGGGGAAFRRALDEILREETRRLLRLPHDGDGGGGGDDDKSEGKRQSDGDESDRGRGEGDGDPSLVVPTGVAMGGPVPPQAPLDWTFRLCPRA